MKSLLRIIFWILMIIPAALVTYILGSIISTQFVLAALNTDVPFAERMTTTIYDIRYMILYAIIVLLGFTIAFPVAALVKRALPGLARWAYIIAGATAIFAALGLMYNQFGTVPISGARSIPGFIAQVLVGAFGGWVFTQLTQRKSKH